MASDFAFTSVDPHTVTTILTEHLPQLKTVVIRLMETPGVGPSEGVGPST